MLCCWVVGRFGSLDDTNSSTTLLKRPVVEDGIKVLEDASLIVFFLVSRLFHPAFRAIIHIIITNITSITSIILHGMRIRSAITMVRSDLQFRIVDVVVSRLLLRQPIAAAVPFSGEYDSDSYYYYCHWKYNPWETVE